MKKKILVVLCAVCAAGATSAEEPAHRRNEMLESRDPLIEPIREVRPKQPEPVVEESKPAVAPLPEDGSVRVPYIPEPVKEQLRKEIEENLREQVTEEVVRRARKERWGVSDAWPEWVRRMDWTGDLRLRAQRDDFAKDNAANIIPDAQRINQTGSNAQVLNSSEDRDRLRTRLRLGARANVIEGYDVGFRFATGSSSDPVSTNQTLGNTNRPYSILVERAFLRYQTDSKALTFFGGRMPNPWFGTDLVWDDDFAFDGLALNFHPLLRLEDSGYRDFDPYLTLGAFPIQEVELSSKDKWLLGAQLGFNWRTSRHSRLSFGLGYYDYKNIEGQLNSSNSNLNDYTAPQFVQKGNTMFQLSDENNGFLPLYGLASDYNELNLTVALALLNFAPTQIILSADYVKNVGFKRDDVERRINSSYSLTVPFEEDTWGAQFKITVGHVLVDRKDDWQVYVAHKRLGSDAVLDAFTDSDFHLGGTDAQGWIFGTSYAINEGVVLGFRTLSSSEIHGAPFSVDTYQFDLSAKF